MQRYEKMQIIVRNIDIKCQMIYHLRKETENKPLNLRKKTGCGLTRMKNY